jgi:hypothetical protein
MKGTINPSDRKIQVESQATNHALSWGTAWSFFKDLWRSRVVLCFRDLMLNKILECQGRIVLLEEVVFVEAKFLKMFECHFEGFGGQGSEIATACCSQHKHGNLMQSFDLDDLTMETSRPTNTKFLFFLLLKLALQVSELITLKRLFFEVLGIRPA